MKSRILFALAAALLCSCSSTAPEFSVEPADVSQKAKVSEDYSKSEPEAEKQQKTVPENVISNNTVDVNEQELSRNETAVKEKEILPLPAQTDTVAQVVEKRPDPYVEIQKIVASTFGYADSLLAAGATDSAIAVIDRFAVLNPLWESWIKRAENTVASAREKSSEKSARYSAIAMQLVNENATNADYQSVRSLADSLIAMEPGDSLVAFAQRQVSIAFSKSYRKANAEKQKIADDAEKSGDFVKADSMANRLLLRYRDFADTLKLEEWIERIHTQAILNSMDGDYWKKNPPKETLAKAEKLVAEGKYAEAKDLYIKLGTSSERVVAMDALKNLGNSVCQSARKTASSLFAKAMSSKKTEEKQQLLTNAIGSLEKCLENFPDAREAKKASDDLKVLLQEIK